MKAIDRLLIKAKKVQNRVIAFLPFIVPNKATADTVSSELDELYGERPYKAVIIYGEEELEDDTDGVKLEHIGDMDLLEGGEIT